MAAVRTHEILTEREEDGVRSRKYRWTVTGAKNADGGPLEPFSGEEWAHDLIEPLSQDVLADRWRGLMAHGENPTKLQRRLDNVLVSIAEGITRRDQQDTVVVEGEPQHVDSVMDIDGLEKVVRDWILERAAKVADR